LNAAHERRYDAGMDAFSIAYYGTICGLLALGAPILSTWFRRLLFGTCAGLIAAVVLPILQGQIYH